MHEYHRVRVSRSLLITLVVSHALGALAIYFYFPAGLLKLSSLAALCLFAALEYRRLIRLGIIRLRVIPHSAGIEYEHLGQPYFFRKYKVYQTRWFAILKLMDSNENRTLILMPDSFDSVQSYRRLRRQIRRLEQLDAA
ncbi:MAG: hypothetical protein EP300_12815 [Gammaproteobacteria bacterium]|nr:MAG: hypothetical protein EP300_12815 [Gammaproteobacteria bacterium]